MQLRIYFVLLFAIVYCSADQTVAKCGRRFIGQGLVFGGVKSQPNSWPWLVALNYVPKNMFYCSGSLISSKHVLSTAHCFKKKHQKTPISSKNVTAYVGKHNLSSPHEIGSVNHEISQIKIHPHWDSESIRYDADISLLVLAIEVTFNGFIEPVCLPQSSQNEIAGVGTVVGWGTSETSEALNKIMDTTPNELNMPIISYRDCFLTTHELAAIASNRTFCAGFFNQSKSICTGDAGAGFYSFDQDSGLTSVKGMASASLKKRGSCNKEFYAIYTKVVDFMEWIKQEMKNH